jgi:hypothetical protein
MTGFCEREQPAGEQCDRADQLVKTSPIASDFWACPQLNRRVREMGYEKGQASSQEQENAEVPKWNQSAVPLFILTLAITAPSLFPQARSGCSFRRHFPLATNREMRFVPVSASASRRVYDQNRVTRTLRGFTERREFAVTKCACACSLPE